VLVLVDAAGGGFWPLGMTMGVDLASPALPPLSLSASDFNCGGQPTDVGGQLSVLLSDPAPGGEQPAPAPKSPAVVQSALATPIGTTHPMSENAAAAIQIRKLIA